LLWLAIFGSATSAYAFQLGSTELELQPYIKGGTVAWDELAGIGGHKSMIAAGLTANLQQGSWGARLNGERWWLAEKLDDDKGFIPSAGYAMSADAKYFIPTGIGRFAPFTGLGFDGWQDRQSTTTFDTLTFMSWRGGLAFDHERGYLSAAALLPFAINAVGGNDPSARIGFTAEAGVYLGPVVAGLFFKTIGFQDPDAKMVQSGLFLAYSFR
jgi:hypothetical protein